jgi:hypothetical protein
MATRNELLFETGPVFKWYLIIGPDFKWLDLLKTELEKALFSDISGTVKS